jgi:2-methylcitrate dehydratase PrpD
MATTRDLARFAADLRYEDLPARVVHLAKRQVLALLGAVFAGAGTGSVQTIARGLGRPGPAPGKGHDLASLRATALPLGAALAVEDAAYLNAAASIAHDMDDYLVFGHTGHSAVIAALAVGEALGSSGKDVLAAIVAANELGGRLGGACLVGPQNGQLWSYIHALGGAAGAARLLGLDARTAGHALGIALAQPPFGLWPGFMGPDSKLLTAAEPLRAGIRAAFLAAAGLTGPAEVLEGPTGLLARVPFVSLPGFFSGLGRAWLTETLSVKVAPGCAYVSTAVVAACEAIAALKRERGGHLDPEEVEKITVSASLLTLEMDRLARPYIAQVSAGGAAAPPLTPVVVNFSTELSIAVALLDDGELSPAALAEERLARDQDVILRFARRVHVEHDVGRTANLLQECDRVLDLAALLESVPLADLAGAARAQHALLGGRPVASTVQDLLEILRALGPSGRDFARRLVERRARGAAAKLGKRIARALDEVVPTGDQHVPRPAPPEREGYDLAERPLASFRAVFGAAVRLKDRDGRTAEASCEVPPGAAGRDDAETDKLVHWKFHKHADAVLGEERATALERLVLALESQGDLRALGSLTSR